MPTPLLGGSEMASPPVCLPHPPEKVVLISGEVVDGHPYAARRDPPELFPQMVYSDQSVLESGTPSMVPSSDS